LFSELKAESFVVDELGERKYALPFSLPNQINEKQRVLIQNSFADGSEINGSFSFELAGQREVFRLNK
jgi:hypothetical protein